MSVQTGNVWHVPQGKGGSWDVVVSDQTGPLMLAGTEPLAAIVWAGKDQPSIPNVLQVIFKDPPIGLTSAFANAVTTTALAVGLYVVELDVTIAGTVYPYYEGWLEIQDSPGTSILRPAYITARDIRKIAPWIDDLQIPDDQTGFLDQCADARDWLDEMILRNYRGGNVSLLGYHGFALDAWYTGGGRRTSLTNRWLFGALKQNQLLVSPRLKETMSYYALSKICESMITKGQQYVGLAARYRHESEMMLSSSVAEIDVNGDGFGEVPVNFSSTNTLWA